MKAWWKILLAAVVIIAFIATGVTAAVASSGGVSTGKPLKSGDTKVSGTFGTIKSIEDPNPMIDNNTIVMTTVDYNWVHGSFEGVDRVESTMTLDTQTGAFTFEGVEMFTGTLNGVYGTLVSTGAGSGQMLDITGENYTVHGDTTAVMGTGGLAGIVGGTLSYDEQVSGGVESPVSYSGTCHIK